MKKSGGVGVSPAFFDHLVGRGPWQARFFHNLGRLCGKIVWDAL